MWTFHRQNITMFLVPLCVSFLQLEVKYFLHKSTFQTLQSSQTQNCIALFPTHT